MLLQAKRGDRKTQQQTQQLPLSLLSLPCLLAAILKINEALSLPLKGDSPQATAGGITGFPLQPQHLLLLQQGAAAAAAACCCCNSSIRKAAAAVQRHMQQQQQVSALRTRDRDKQTHKSKQRLRSPVADLAAAVRAPCCQSSSSSNNNSSSSNSSSYKRRIADETTTGRRQPNGESPLAQC